MLLSFWCHFPFQHQNSIQCSLCCLNMDPLHFQPDRSEVNNCDFNKDKFNLLTLIKIIAIHCDGHIFISFVFPTVHIISFQYNIILFINKCYTKHGQFYIHSEYNIFIHMSYD